MRPQGIDLRTGCNNTATPENPPAPATDLPVSAEEFSALLDRLPHDFSKDFALAIAVSGGPDSMALTFLLHRWAQSHHHPLPLHALIVDHGLRPESGQEAHTVQNVLKDWQGLTAVILRWEHPPLEGKILETARHARYALLSSYCETHGIRILFLGHHRDDQAETVLFRLAKGSGLDGLAGINPVQPLTSHLTLARPLLDIPKTRLIETCRAQALPVIQDPSNTSLKFARIRLRGARALLEQEGLSAKRLAKTAARLARAKNALNTLSQKAYQQISKQSGTDRIVFNLSAFRTVPAEISLRCLCYAVETLYPAPLYPPRLEKMELLHEGLLQNAPFRKQSFAGVLFNRNDTKDEIHLTREHPASPE